MRAPTNDRPRSCIHRIPQKAIPYASLWVAVLVKALSDAGSDLGLNVKDRAKGERDSRRGMYRRKFAREWIFSDETEPQSFLWICSCLGLDAQHIRMNVLGAA